MKTATAMINHFFFARIANNANVSCLLAQAPKALAQNANLSYRKDQHIKNNRFT